MHLYQRGQHAVNTLSSNTFNFTEMKLRSLLEIHVADCFHMLQNIIAESNDNTAISRKSYLFYKLFQD